VQHVEEVIGMAEATVPAVRKITVIDMDEYQRGVILAAAEGVTISALMMTALKRYNVENWHKVALHNPE